MRGEDFRITRTAASVTETPPHARGRLSDLPLRAIGLRNTPACAGKTFSRSARSFAFWKHPRMRGEDQLIHLGRLVVVETPPHARGRPSLYLTCPAAIGNTPACAGKTKPEKIDLFSEKKHPRMRGEDLTSVFLPSNNSETPPHARGRPRRAFLCRLLQETPPHARGRQQNPVPL